MTEHWIWFASRRGFGPVRQRELLERFGSAEAVWHAGKEIYDREGLTSAAQEVLLDKDLGEAKRILRLCGQKQITVLPIHEERYPSFLRAIADAPTVLYLRGRLPETDGTPCVGIVGARSADRRGLTTARQLGWQIAGCGGIVVTGLARGIDTMAARGALDNGGTVIGVLGCGVDVVYPRENAVLFAEVLLKGCLLSEYPPGSAPDARHFPVRNRIISALSDGVVVVQASERSGALITARWAADQGRDVFAVPGPAGEELSRGCNRLLREGAILAESGWDVMCEYEYRYPGKVREYHGRPEPETRRQAPSAALLAPERAEAPAAQTPASSAAQTPASSAAQTPAAAPEKPTIRLSSLTPPQRAVAEALRKGPLQLDDLLDRLDLPTAQVLSQLTMLQIRGVIAQKPGRTYELTSKIDTK